MTLAAAEADVLLARGELRIAIVMRPFAITVHRGPRRLIRAASIWAAEGVVHDLFVQMTEGVIAHEDLELPERPVSAEVLDRGPSHATLAIGLDGG